MMHSGHVVMKRTEHKVCAGAGGVLLDLYLLSYKVDDWTARSFYCNWLKKLTIRSIKFLFCEESGD